MLRVIEINEPQDLCYVRGNWDRLWQATEGANFFQTLSWLQIYWKHFSEGKHLRVLLVLNREHLVGVVPLVVVEEPTRLGRVRVLTYPLADWGTRFGVLAEKPREALTAALRHVQKTPRQWDMLDLRWIGEDDQERNQTGGAMSEAGFPPTPGIWKETLIVDFDGSWDDYLRTRSPKLRAEMRRKIRKFEESGRIQLERYRPRGKDQGDADPRWDLFKQACDIAELSWQGRSSSGTTITHSQIHNYIKDCHLAAVDLGMLDLALLHFDQRPVGFCYNYIAKGRLFGLRRGDSPEAREHGLGSVLTAILIRDSFRRGDVTLDMGPGSFEVKRRWMTRIETVGRMTYYPLGTPKVQLLRMKHWWQMRQDRKAGRLHRQLDEKSATS